MTLNQLEEYLKTNCKGREKAITGEELRRGFRISEKELRKKVSRLRKQHVPVCSGPTGYYYPRHAGDVVLTIRHLERLAAAIQMVIQWLTECLEQFGEEVENEAEDMARTNTDEERGRPRRKTFSQLGRR